MEINTSTSMGELVISEEVISAIATNAAKDVDGIAGFSNRPVDVVNTIKKGSLKVMSPVRVLADGEDLNISIYVNMLPGKKIRQVAEEVQRAVMEEMLVDKLSPTLEQQLLSANPDMDVEEMKDLAILSDEEIFRGMLEVRRDIQRRYRLGPEDFRDFWKNVDQRRADGYGQETAPEEEGAQP